MRPPPLASRAAIVTGAGRGIGRATAARLAADGAAVVVADLDGAAAAEAAAEIAAAEATSSAGGQAIAIGGDCADPADAHAIAAAALEAFGRLDILVNNAGITADRIFHKLTAETLDSVLDANLRTTFQMTQAVVGHLRAAAKREIAELGAPAQHRKIVNTSSVVAYTGNPGQWNYTAAKGAIISSTKTLARELGPFWINVNAVAPGFVETRLTQSLDSPEGQRTGLGIPAGIREGLTEQISLRRLGRPADIANVTAFLVGPDSDYITGVTIPVTGGQLGGMG